MGRFLFVLFVPLIVGCALNPPRVEMTHAELTLQAAIEAGAERWAPELVQKAKDQFRLAEGAMRERLYSDARKHAKEALQFAEQAEEKAILQGAP